MEINLLFCYIVSGSDLGVLQNSYSSGKENKERMKVSVVLCTYTMQRYDDFNEAAESILNQAYESIELVVVVDSNSAVYNRAMEDFGSRRDVFLHNNSENRGVSYSRTKGAALASGEVVAFIDDDAIAEKNWIAELVAAYEEHNAVSVGGRMEGEWIADRPWFLPTEFDWLVGVTHPGFGVDGEEVRNTFESNLSFRRDVFLELGGFDKELGPDADSYSHSEGAEIGIRLQAEYDRGVVYNADAVVRHKVFEHRTQVLWLLSRAFEQGASKRRMSVDSASSTGEESAYLSQLAFDRVPRRINGLIRSPSIGAVAQLVMLFVFTAAVGIGYIYAMVHGK